MQKKMLDLNYKHSNKKNVKIQNSHLHINTIYWTEFNELYPALNQLSGNQLGHSLSVIFFLIPVAETYETEPKNRHALITKNRKDENEIEAGIL